MTTAEPTDASTERAELTEDQVRAIVREELELFARADKQALLSRATPTEVDPDDLPF